MISKQVTIKELSILLENFEARELMIFTFKESREKKGFLLHCYINDMNYVLFGAAHKPKEKVFRKIATGIEFLKKYNINKFAVILEKTTS